MEATTMEKLESGKSTDGNRGRGQDAASSPTGQTSHSAKDSYDKISRTVNETFGRVKSYSRENPGTVTLIAFGAGIGVAMLLFGSRNPHSRARRIVSPMTNALTNVVSTLLR